jgi:hypothetical protein
LKQDSQTSFTTLFAISSDLQDGLLSIESIARRLTQLWSSALPRFYSQFKKADLMLLVETVEPPIHFS